MRVVSLFSVLVLFSTLACQPPDSPETVVRKWQAAVDNNRFEEAKALSSPRTKDLISWMEALFTEMETDSTVTHTDFSDLKCREEGDRAVCTYSLKESGQSFPDSFVLVRMNGQWLVDLPDEPTYEEDTEALELFDMLDQDSLDQ